MVTLASRHQPSLARWPRDRAEGGTQGLMGTRAANPPWAQRRTTRLQCRRSGRARNYRQGIPARRELPHVRDSGAVMKQIDYDAEQYQHYARGRSL
jgi:hypothetical protein